MKVESIGTFGEREASTIASAIKLTLNIEARTERLTLDSGPTERWHVNVPARDLKIVRAWLKGWNTGRACQSIERNPANACLWPDLAAIFPTEIAS